MRSSTLSLLLPVAVSASPLVNPTVVNDVFCKVNNIVISALSKDNAATTYCSSFLSIPTSTLSTTVTQTPSSVTTTLSTTVAGQPTTTTLTETATTTAQVTSTTTSTTTVLTTITSTTSTSTITCLDSAFTYTAPTGVIPAADGPVRRGAAPTKPAAIPAAWASSYVSTACSCLSIPTPSVTKTTTKTLPPGTVSVTSTIVATPTITALETTTVTQTSTVPVTQTATTTSTVIAYAVATTIASNGAQYRQYQSPFSGDVNAAYFKTVSPDYSGTSSSLTFSTPNWPSDSSYSITLADGYTFYSYQSALLFQGFFIAKETGTYLFYSNSGEIDNWGYVWTGSNAYAAWTDGNENFKNHYDGGDTTMSTSIQMNAGDAVPLTYLWINTGGPGRSKFRIHTPGGTELNGGDGYFVKACSAATFP